MIYKNPIIIGTLTLISSVMYFELYPKNKNTGSDIAVDVINVGLNDVGPIKNLPFKGK